MTFSEKVKNELSGFTVRKDCCAMAQLYGMLLFGKSFSKESISLHTVNKATADHFADLLVNYTSSIVTITEIGQTAETDKILYLVEVEDEIDRARILSCFSQSSFAIHRDNLKQDCCKSAFLRGCFLSCGSITDPEKEYHLEFVLSSTELAHQLQALLEEWGFPLKDTARKESRILYCKGSESIEDLLTFMGAVKSTLALMDIKIVKDVRNKANRVTNCETANIDKTVAAAAIQRKAIQWIAEHQGLDSLPDELRAVAELRLQNPELSLSELCLVSGLGLSKSGLNHRLKKIVEIAKNKL